MSEREQFEAFCYENNILIHMVDNLSTKVRGYCYYDGFYYNVVLNIKFCGVQLKKTTIHEIIHIMKNHFALNLSTLEVCEKEVNYLIEKTEMLYCNNNWKTYFGF